MFNFNSADREGQVTFFRGCRGEVEVRGGGSVPACALRQHLGRRPHLEGMRRHLDQLKTYSLAALSDVAQLVAVAALVCAGMTVSAAVKLSDPDAPLYKVVMPVLARSRSISQTTAHGRRMTRSSLTRPDLPTDTRDGLFVVAACTPLGAETGTVFT